jgi:hypothetical protein
LARVLAWHARGHGFESHILHETYILSPKSRPIGWLFCFYLS